MTTTNNFCLANMKISILLGLIFLTVIVIAADHGQDETDLIGCTELNGYGCVCHTTERDTSVNVWVEGPETLYVGQMGLYKMFLAGGPAEAGGYNVAGRFGQMELVDTFSFRHNLALNELTQAFSLPFPSVEDTIYWEFGYTASDSSSIDTIYSCGLSIVWDTIPDPLDRWNFGPKFPLTILDVTSINSDKEIAPAEYILKQNYPNPFNPSTKIEFILVEPGFVNLKVFNILGEELVQLINKELSAGLHSVDFNASQLTSGIYFYSINVEGKFSSVRKMLLVK